MIAFSDPQPRDSVEISYIRDDVVSEIIGTNAVLGITLGDVMYNDLSLFEYYNQIVAQVGIPFYNVPGNHDMNFKSPDDHYAMETFKRHFGPNYYSFDYGQVHFIVLDDVEWMGRDSTETSNYRGKIGSKQLQWLKNDLKFVPDEKLIVLSMHIPIYTFISNHESVNITDRDLLFEILQDRKHLLALAGHMHLTEHQYFDKTIGWNSPNQFHQIVCAAVSGSWWSGKKDESSIPIADQRDGVPNGYHIFHFDGNQYNERFKAARLDRDEQIRISFPYGQIPISYLQDSTIVANVFNASSKSVVKYRLDNSDFMPMKIKIQPDPFFKSIHKNNISDYPSWIKPRKSNHIFVAPFPNDLKTGIHTIEIITQDQYGREFKKVKIFEVAEF